jgi:hypothetical protein
MFRLDSFLVFFLEQLVFFSERGLNSNFTIGKMSKGPARKRQKCGSTLLNHDSDTFIKTTIEDIHEANPHMTVTLHELTKWSTILKCMIEAASNSIYFQFSTEGVTIMASSSASNTCMSYWNKDMFHEYKLTEPFSMTILKSELDNLRRSIPVCYFM